MQPLRLQDDRQREHVFRRPPERLVSLVPSETLNLFALGAGGRLLGRTRYCVLPEGEVERIPTVGGTKDADADAIAALAPDLVLANQEENTKAIVAALAERGIPVFVSFPNRVAEGLSHLARLVRILGLEADARARAAVAEGYSALREAESAGEERERRGLLPLAAFVPIWMDPLMTIAEDTFVHDALLLAGARNVFADRRRRYPLAADLGRAAPLSQARVGERDTRYPRVTLDEVRERTPEIVLLPDEPHPFSAEDAAVFLAQDTPAARARKVVFCPGRDLTWPGLLSLQGLSRTRALVDSLR